MPKPGPLIKRTATPQPAVRQAIVLWRLLNKKGRLYPRTHDEKFVRELRSRLKIPISTSVDKYLRSSTVTTTEFMLAVLSALQPFGQMLSDVYALFERHGITRSDGNLRVEFDFGAAYQKLKFDANHFRSAIKAYTEVMKSVHTRLFAYRDLLTIFSEIEERLTVTIGASPDTARPDNISEPFWSWRYGKQGEDALFVGRWPFQSPPPLPIWGAGDPLREALRPFATAAVSLCEIASRFSSWDEMRARTIGAGKTSDVGDPLRAAVFSWDPALHGYYFSDRIVERFLQLIWDVHHFAPTDKHARAVFAAQIETVINEHSDPGEGRFPATPLEEFLDLPVWKHRSKIYCIWLVSVVARVFTHSGKFELCGEDGALVFAFAETRIARIRWNGIVMQLIAEMRTPAGAAALTGKGRIDNIQPDYVLRRTDVSPASTLYVLEAKQYGKPSLQNFARSLRDYAVVHTSALVGLANYGPVSAKVAQTVAALAVKMKDANLTSRCAAFGNVEPTFPQSIDALCDHLRGSLPDIVGDPSATPATLIVDVSQSMVAVLPPYEEHINLWRNLGLGGLSILFAAGGFQMEISGYQGSNFGHEICKHRQYSAFAMPQIPPNRREGSIFLTDETGYTETSEFHGSLAAIIVLGLNCSARLCINLAYWDLMVVMFASLLTSSTITVSVYS